MTVAYPIDCCPRAAVAALRGDRVPLPCAARAAIVERKRRRHANDDRAVGSWELRLRNDGSTAVWAEPREARR